MKLKQIREKYANEFQVIGTLERTLWQTITENGGLNNQESWIASCNLSKELTSLGEKLLKQGDYEQAEVYLSRAQQFTDPSDDRKLWIHQPDWFQTRIILSLSLNVIYMKEKRYASSYDMLTMLSQQCEQSHLADTISRNIFYNLDGTYFQLLCTCIEQQKYDQAFTAARKAIAIIDNYEKDYEKQLQQLDEGLVNENSIRKYGQILAKKQLLRTYCFYQGGRALYKSGEKQNALKFFKMAWKQAKDQLPQDDSKLRAYHAKYVRVRDELEFNRQLEDQSIDDFSKFTSEVNKQRENNNNNDNYSNQDDRHRSNNMNKSSNSRIARRRQFQSLSLPNSNRSENIPRGSVNLRHKRMSQDQQSFQFSIQRQSQQQQQQISQRQSITGNNNINSNYNSKVSPKRISLQHGLQQDLPITGNNNSTKQQNNINYPMSMPASARSPSANSPLHAFDSQLGFMLNNNEKNNKQPKNNNNNNNNKRPLSSIVTNGLTTKQPANPNNIDNLSLNSPSNSSNSNSNDSEISDRQLDSSASPLGISSDSPRLFSKTNKTSQNQKKSQKNSKKMSSQQRGQMILQRRNSTPQASLNDVLSLDNNPLDAFLKIQPATATAAISNRLSERSSSYTNPHRSRRPSTAVNYSNQRQQFSSFDSLNKKYKYASNNITGSKYYQQSNSSVSMHSPGVSPHALRPKALGNFLLGGGKIGGNAQKEVSKIRKYYEETFGKKKNDIINTHAKGQEEQQELEFGAIREEDAETLMKSEQQLKSEGNQQDQYEKYRVGDERVAQRGYAESVSPSSSSAAKKFLSRMFSSSSHSRRLKQHLLLNTSENIQQTSTLHSKHGQSSISISAKHSNHSSLHNNNHSRHSKSTHSAAGTAATYQQLYFSSATTTPKSSLHQSQQTDQQINNQPVINNNIIPDIDQKNQNTNKLNNPQESKKQGKFTNVFFFGVKNNNNSNKFPFSFNNSSTTVASQSSQLLTTAKKSQIYAQVDKIFAQDKSLQLKLNSQLLSMKTPTATQQPKTQQEQINTINNNNNNNINHSNNNNNNNGTFNNLNIGDSVKSPPNEQNQNIQANNSSNPLNQLLLDALNQQKLGMAFLQRPATASRNKNTSAELQLQKIKQQQQKSQQKEHSSYISKKDIYKQMIDGGIQDGLTTAGAILTTNGQDQSQLLQQQPLIQLQPVSTLIDDNIDLISSINNNDNNNQQQYHNANSLQVSQGIYTTNSRGRLLSDNSHAHPLKQQSLQTSTTKLQRLKTQTSFSNLTQQQIHSYKQKKINMNQGGLQSLQSSMLLQPQQTQLQSSQQSQSSLTQQQQQQQQSFQTIEKRPSPLQKQNSMTFSRVASKRTLPQVNITSSNAQQTALISKINMKTTVSLAVMPEDELDDEEDAANHRMPLDQDMSSHDIDSASHSHNHYASHLSAPNSPKGQELSKSKSFPNSILRNNSSIKGNNDGKQMMQQKDQNNDNMNKSAHSNQNNNNDNNNKSFNNNDKNNSLNNNSGNHSNNNQNNNNNNLKGDNETDGLVLEQIVTEDIKKRSLSMTFLKESLEDKDEIKEEEDEDKLSHSVSIIAHTEKKESPVTPQIHLKRSRSEGQRQLFESRKSKHHKSLHHRVIEQRQLLDTVLEQKKNHCAMKIQQYWRSKRILGQIAGVAEMQESEEMDQKEELFGVTSILHPLGNVNNTINASSMQSVSSKNKISYESSFRFRKNQQANNNNNNSNITGHNLTSNLNIIVSSESILPTNPSQLHLLQNPQKKSDGSFKSSKKHPFLIGFTPTPSKYAMSQHFFPSNNEQLAQLTASQAIPHLQQSTLLTGHKAPSISNNTFMSFFKDPKKKKQAIQARQTLRDIQQEATLPLKFYLSHIQKGLSFWKVNDFIALFNVKGDDVLVTMRFGVKVLGFEGMLSMKVNLGLSEMIRISGLTNLTKWGTANELLSNYMKSIGFDEKKSEDTGTLKSDRVAHSSLLLLDGFDLDKIKFQLQIDQLTNKESSSNASQGTIQNNSNSQEKFKVMKISGETIEIQDILLPNNNNTNITQNPQPNINKGLVIQQATPSGILPNPSLSSTSIIELPTNKINQTQYQKNLSTQRQFLKKRNQLVRNLSSKSIMIVYSNLRHMPTAQFKNPLSVSDNSKSYNGSSRQMMLSSRCSIDDELPSDKFNKLQTLKLSSEQTLPRIPSSMSFHHISSNPSIFKNSSQQQAKDHFAQFLKDQNTFDSPDTPIEKNNQLERLPSIGLLSSYDPENYYPQGSVGAISGFRYQPGQPSVFKERFSNSVQQREQQLSMSQQQSQQSQQPVNMTTSIDSQQYQLMQQQMMDNNSIQPRNSIANSSQFTRGILQQYPLQSTLMNKNSARRSSLFFQKVVEARFQQEKQQQSSSLINNLNEKQEDISRHIERAESIIVSQESDEGEHDQIKDFNTNGQFAEQTSPSAPPLLLSRGSATFKALSSQKQQSPQFNEIGNNQLDLQTKQIDYSSPLYQSLATGKPTSYNNSDAKSSNSNNLMYKSLNQYQYLQHQSTNPNPLISPTEPYQSKQSPLQHQSSNPPTSQLLQPPSVYEPSQMNQSQRLYNQQTLPVNLSQQWLGVNGNQIGQSLRLKNTPQTSQLDTSRRPSSYLDSPNMTQSINNLKQDKPTDSNFWSKFKDDTISPQLQQSTYKHKQSSEQFSEQFFNGSNDGFQLISQSFQQYKQPSLPNANRLEFSVQSYRQGSLNTNNNDDFQQTPGHGQQDEQLSQQERSMFSSFAPRRINTSALAEDNNPPTSATPKSSQLNKKNFTLAMTMGSSNQKDNLKDNISEQPNPASEYNDTDGLMSQEKIKQLELLEKQLRKQKRANMKLRMKQYNFWSQYEYFEEYSNNKYFYVPDSYINPFYQNEILLQTFLKKNNDHFLAVLRIKSSQQHEEIINIQNRNGIDVVIEVFQTRIKAKWFDSMQMNLFLFLDEFFPSNDLDILQENYDELDLGENQEFKLNFRFQRLFKFNKFLYNRGFNTKQSIQVQKQLRGKITIDNCKLSLIQTTKYKQQLLQDQQQLRQQQQQLALTVQNNQISNPSENPVVSYETPQFNLGQDENQNNITNQSPLNNLGLQSAKDYSKYLVIKERSTEMDIDLIKSILDEQDEESEDLMKILFNNQTESSQSEITRNTHECDDNCSRPCLLKYKSNTESTSQSSADNPRVRIEGQIRKTVKAKSLIPGQKYRNIPRKSVNFQGLLENRGSATEQKRRSTLSPFTLITQILKVSAKLKQGIVKIERNVNKTLVDQNNEHFSRVNENTLVAQGDIQILEYYNTPVKVALSKNNFMYCLRDHRSGYVQSVRIRFVREKMNNLSGNNFNNNNNNNNNGSSNNNNNLYYPTRNMLQSSQSANALRHTSGIQYAVIIIDDRLNQLKSEKVIIRGQESIEKLVNIIQYSSETQIPVFKLNLPLQHIGFFKKMQFASFISYNKDAMMNQIMQKYNEKDEALFDLLHNPKNLLKEQIYLSLYFTRIKLSLISNFLSTRKHEQNFFLSTYFLSQKCSQVCSIKDIGRVIIQTIVYASNPMFTSDKSVFMCLHIFSKKMRNTYSKFIITIQDIQSLIWKEFVEESCLDKDKIIKAVSLLSEKLVYFNSKQFFNFKLPLFSLTKNSKKARYDLLNNFEMTPEPLELTKSILANKTLLTPILRCQKVVFTAIKKIFNHFTIFTVRWVGTLDFYCLEVYIPKTGRKWTTNVYASDLWKLSTHFMEELFPYVYWSHPNVLEVIRAYKRQCYIDFTQKYESSMKQNPSGYINEINAQQQEHNHQFYTSSQYNSTTRSKYEKLFEQYSTVVASSPRFMGEQQNQHQQQQTSPKTSSNRSVVISSEHQIFERQLSSLRNIEKDSGTPMEKYKNNRKQFQRQTSILKKSTSSFSNAVNTASGQQQQQQSYQQIQNNQINDYPESSGEINYHMNSSSQSIQQQRTTAVRYSDAKQITFNEFIKENKQVASPSPYRPSLKGNQEDIIISDQYYSTYAKSKQQHNSGNGNNSPFDQQQQQQQQSSSQQPQQYKQNPSQFLKLFNKTLLGQTDVLELKIWEKLIDKMQVRVNDQSKIILAMDSFKGLLKEVLGTFVTHLRSEDNALIQISIEKQVPQIKSKMLLYSQQPSHPIMDTETSRVQSQTSWNVHSHSHHGKNKKNNGNNNGNNNNNNQNNNQNQNQNKSKKKKDKKNKKQQQQQQQQVQNNSNNSITSYKNIEKLSNNSSSYNNIASISNFMDNKPKRNISRFGQRQKSESNDEIKSIDGSQLQLQQQVDQSSFQGVDQSGQLDSSNSSDSQKSSESSMSSLSSSSSSGSMRQGVKVLGLSGNNNSDSDDGYDEYGNPIEGNNSNNFANQEILEKELFGSCISLYLEESFKYDVFIRLNFFEKLSTQNEKIQLNLLLTQYFAANNIQLQANQQRFRKGFNNGSSSIKSNLSLNKQAEQEKKTAQSIFSSLRKKLPSYKKNNNNNNNNNADSSDDEQTNNQEDQTNKTIYPENYRFGQSDLLSMASMIKNKVRENYLPSALYEEEEYFRQQQKKQGKAFRHFESILQVNRVRRTTLLVGDESPQNEPAMKKSFIAPNTYQSDQIPQKMPPSFSFSDAIDTTITTNNDIPINKLPGIPGASNNSNTNGGSALSAASQSILALMHKAPKSIIKMDNNNNNNKNNSIITNPFKPRNTAGTSGTQAPSMASSSSISGGQSMLGSRLKSILVSQPSFFQNIEEAVKFEPKVKLNCDVSIQRLVDPKHKHFIILYRGVFTSKPFQMIAIYYKTSKHKFYAEIWNVKTQQKAKQKIKFKQICYQVPCVKQLLQLKQYSEIGRRIFLAFKNTLMIATYYQVNA